MGERVKDWTQTDLMLQERPPVVLTEKERSELITALAELLLTAVGIHADE